MKLRPKITLIDHFAKLTDPRIDRTKEHLLIDIVTIAICAIICPKGYCFAYGADNWVAMETYGKSKQDWLQEFLELPNGIPSHDTFARVFARIDPNEFQQCFRDWLSSIAQLISGEVVSIDGKTLKHSGSKGIGKKAIHMVNAWASEQRLVLGQTKVNDKSNEITAIPELIKLLELKGCIVTIDAMGTQTQIAQIIQDSDADYCLALKGNHKHLHEFVQQVFAQAQAQDWQEIEHSFHRTIDKDHGRTEIRRYWTIPIVEFFLESERWAGLQSIGLVESVRKIGQQTTTSRRYYLNSFASDARLLAHAVRRHWGIENSLHFFF